MSEKSTSWGVFLGQTFLATLLSASIIGIFVNYAIEETRFTRDWKERSLSEVVGPVVMHLDRTARVADRYSDHPASYLEAQIMRDSNEAVRSILLRNGHLIPTNLVVHAHKLVEHYDVWIRRFDEKVARENPTPDIRFDVGFSNPGFPEDAQIAFKESFVLLRMELYEK